MNFKELGLQSVLIKAIKKERILTPTQVQKIVFPQIVKGEHVIVQSQTGTGKTLAYLLPLMNRLDPKGKGTEIIICTPTYELAMQIQKQIERLNVNSGLNLVSVPIIGNVNIKRQVELLKKKPRIVVGTSGRILELIKKKKIPAHLVRTVVIDEADKMLDKQNLETTKAVLKCCLRDVQKLFFSASMDKETITKALEAAPGANICKVKETLHVPSDITHICFVAERRDKIMMLRKLAKSIEPKKAMVFINKVSDIEEATKKLQYHQYQAKCIHGEVPKGKRKQLIDEFQRNKLQFLIATDVAARGLHFDDVSAVFHLSIAEEPNIYLHRAGRTGRNGRKGLSVLIVTESELKLLKHYEKALGIQIKKKKLYQGKIVNG